MEEEVWAPVQGYPDYQVSNFGRVFNTKRQHYGRKGKEIDPYYPYEPLEPW